MAGCTPATQWLDFPPADGAQTMVVASPNGGRVDLVAVDLTNESKPVRIDITDDGSGRATHAMLFASPLSAYGLSDGPLLEPSLSDVVVPFMGNEDAQFGAVADRVYAARIYEAQSDADWESVPGTPSWVAQRTLRKPPPKCPSFSPASTVELDGFPLFVIPYGTNRALVRIYDGGNFIVGGGKVVEVSLPGSVYTAAIVDSDGLVWLGDTSGKVWTARVDPSSIFAELTLFADTRLAAPIDSIAARDGDVFVVAYGGAVARFNGERFVRAGDIGAGRIGSVQWTAPGEAMFASLDPSGVYVIGESVRFDAVNDFGAQSVAWVPSLGPIVGTESGRFYHRVDGAWVALETEAYGWWGAGIAAYDGGFLFHLASGSGGFFHSAIDPCADVFSTGVLIESRIVLLGRDVLVAHVTSDAERTVFTHLSRQ